jgi:hypothetical protein
VRRHTLRGCLGLQRQRDERRGNANRSR